MEVSNKLYIRNVKEILVEPIRRFPHVSAPHVLVTYNKVEQILNNQLYSARLTRQEEINDSKDIQGYLACGFIASAGSITKRASLYLILLAAIISY